MKKSPEFSTRANLKCQAKPTGRNVGKRAATAENRDPTNVRDRKDGTVSHEQQAGPV